MTGEAARPPSGRAGLRNLLLAAAALLFLLGVAMLAAASPAVGITALGGLLLAAVLAERWRHERRAAGARAVFGGDGLSAPARDVDIVQAYRLFLGREPETPDALAGKRSLDLRGLVGGMLASGEYAARLVSPITAGRAPSGGLFDDPPGEETLAWAGDVLPLGEAARRTLAQVPDWVAAHAAILSDPGMRAAFPDVARRVPADRVGAVAEAAQGRGLIAEVEEATGRQVRGYALDRADPDAVVAVELWIDGEFAGATPADQYRRDLEERFGGSGRHGFAFDDLATDLDAERPVRIEVREGATKRVLGARRVTLRPDRDARRLAELGVALRRAQGDLDAIAGALRQAVGAMGFTPATYGAYWRAYGLRTPAAEQRDAEEAAALAWRPRFDVVVTGDPLDRPAFAVSEASVAAQVYPEHHLTAAPAGGDYVVLIDAGDRLAPDALLRLAALLQSAERPAWVTFDSDTVDGGGEHSDPVCRPGYDPDLLVQTPYPGSCAAVGADALRTALAGGGSLEPAARGDLWLRLSEVGRAGHVSRVLHHARPAALAGPPEDWARAVWAHFDRIGVAAQVRAAPDLHGAASAAEPRVRIDWPLPEGTTAAVVVPTRDRLDLLGPCLASLEASRTANRTPFEIVVVDNASTDPATLAALESLGRSPGGRVIRYDAPFNWSAINNLAARAVDADVLIFLNNDTVVLSPDWCDALCAQAMRPEIGAVGARLLYGDGSIQHAGIVLGTTQAVAAHEGAGAPGSDAGYLGRRALAHRAAAVTGACLATRRELFLRLGGFDEANLGIEANDIDYCLRVRHEGLAVLYEPSCTLHHFESRSRGHTGSDPARRARADRELAALERRWGEELRRDPFYNGHFDRTAAPFTRLGPPPAV